MKPKKETTGKSTGRRLTKREEKFVEAMADPNVLSQRAAAKKAGYSENTASETAYENLKKPHIVEAIEKRKAEVVQHANVTPEQVLGATALRAFATIDDAFDEQGYFDIQKARKTGAIHLVKKMSRKQTKYGEEVSVEFYSNESAQDKLGSYLGMEKMPGQNPSDNLAIAKAVVKELLAKGNNKEEAVSFAAGRYGVLEDDLLNA